MSYSLAEKSLHPAYQGSNTYLLNGTWQSHIRSQTIVTGEHMVYLPKKLSKTKIPNSPVNTPAKTSTQLDQTMSV